MLFVKPRKFFEWLLVSGVVSSTCAVGFAGNWYWTPPVERIVCTVNEVTRTETVRTKTLILPITGPTELESDKKLEVGAWVECEKGWATSLNSWDEQIFGSRIVLGDAPQIFAQLQPNDAFVCTVQRYSPYELFISNSRSMFLGCRKK